MSLYVMHKPTCVGVKESKTNSLFEPRGYFIFLFLCKAG